MSAPADVAFLLDVDNTLLDNDAVQGDLRDYLDREFGRENRDRYWSILETLRDELGYIDYLGALQRYRLDALEDPRLFALSSFLVDYRFAERLYPNAFEVIAHLRQWGPTIILSDGDVVFQPRKVQRSGLWDAVDGRVLIYIHKEEMLADVARRYPARHYVMADDKPWILDAMKCGWEERLTSVFVRQGRYALDPTVTFKRTPDMTLERIGDFLRCDFSAAAAGRAR
jgi:FMN phosphatase YigB (HAD superfamily)